MTNVDPVPPVDDGWQLPLRLRAPAPGWTSYADVVVIGAGIAGLTVALRSADSGSVMVVTKDVLSAGSTRWAQGGIAAALGEGDTPGAHRLDTLVAGVGLCDEAAVDVLVTEGPPSVLELIGLGANFDRSDDGTLSLTREGGHHADRIAHAGGDATGAEVQRALIDAVHANPRIELIEHALALDLLLDDDGDAAGVTLHVIGTGARDGVGAVQIDGERACGGDEPISPSHETFLPDWTRLSAASGVQPIGAV